MNVRTLLGIVMGVAVCIGTNACAPSSADWAMICKDRLAGKDLPESGTVQVVKGLLASPWSDAALLPDPDRNPGCMIPAALNFKTAKDREAFEKAWADAGYSQAISVSGAGEWQTIRWGDIGDHHVRALVLTNAALHGATKPSAETCRALNLQCAPHIADVRELQP